MNSLCLLDIVQDRIRNVCVLAHVDHGKTTLSDHLIASNGLIHPKLAGELRYLDSKEEEQARGITMKSSSISLLYVPGASLHPQGPNAISSESKLKDGILVNLIDSPGHVDFCSEVSTAARLSDGAFVVVDAVEGVCIQTHAVLRQAWEENVRMCLVINKMDRLILELCLDPLEAYERLVAIVSHVNMIVSSFASEKFISEADAVLAHEDAKMHKDNDEHVDRGLEDEFQGEKKDVDPGTKEEDEVFFAPEKGNVAFGSAHDGWAFRISQFAEIYAAKMGASATALVRAMWGNYALQPKTKRIVRIKDSKDGRMKPLFVQLALEPIWKAYSCCHAGEDSKAVLEKIVRSLGLQERVPDKVLGHPDARQALRSVLRAWLPLSEAVLGMAFQHLPSPVSAAPERLSRLLPPRTAALKGMKSTDVEKDLDVIEAAVGSCDVSRKAPMVVYVSKMVAVPAIALPRVTGESPPRNPDEEKFLAFGRVFAGEIREGDTVFVLPSTYNPVEKDPELQEMEIKGLFLMMGRGLERLPQVPAGNILAIAGLDHAILKSATLSSTRHCRPLAPMLFQSAPIVRVAVEPSKPEEMSKLADGLRLLHRADPLVQVGIMENGEHVISAAGEVHLETCIKDLRERFAKIDLIVSPPLVSFRETVSRNAEEELDKTQQSSALGGATTQSNIHNGGKPSIKIVEGSIPSGSVTIRVRALPIPASMATILDQQEENLRMVLTRDGFGMPKSKTSSSLENASSEKDKIDSSTQAGIDEIESLKGNLTKLKDRLMENARAENDSCLPVEKPDDEWMDTLKRVWCLGPKHCGANFLLSCPTSEKETGKNLWNAPAAKVIPVSRQAGMRNRQSDISKGQQKSESYNSDSLSSTLDSLNLSDSAPVQRKQETAKNIQNEAVLSKCQVTIGIGSPAASQCLELSEISESNNAGCISHVETFKEKLREAVYLDDVSTAEYIQHSVEAGVSAGFQLATGAGPLCDEPMWGVAFEVSATLNLPTESEIMDESGNDDAGTPNSMPSGADERSRSNSVNFTAKDLQKLFQEDVYGPLSGQVTSTTRHVLRRAVEEAGARLVEVAFLCEIATSSEGLGPVYAVLGRRRARILREDMREGSGLFSIHAYLPAEASFGFVEELRRRSSGAASASLMLSHWERLGIDPFFIPTTEEQREEYGEEGQGMGFPNLARKLIDAVRRRKGLVVEEKVVESATRQRTLARKV